MKDLLGLFPGGSALLDGRGAVVGFSPDLPRVLGRDPGALPGAPLAELLDAAARETLQRHLAAAAAAGQAEDHVLHGGGVLALRSRALPGGQVLCQIQPRLDRAQLQMLDRSGSMNLLVSSIAHEINNPLTFILNNAQLIEATRAEDIPESVADITDGVQRIGELTGQLRHLASDGDQRLPVDLAEALEECLALISGLLKYHAQVESDIRAMPPIFASPERLTQAILGLLLNAAHAIPQDRDLQENTLYVRAQAEGGWIQVEIEDTGRGVDPDALPRIFEPFFSTWPGHQGLGLAFCRQVIEELGGRVEAEAGRARGARFVLRLPIQATDEGGWN